MKKLKKIYESVPGFILLIMVFLPFVANFFLSNTHPLDNRPLNLRPTHFSRSFSNEFEAYYNDTFAWRRSLLKRYIRLQKKLKIDTGRYFNGQEGWMFYDSAKVSDGNSIIDYRGDSYFSLPEMRLMTEGVKIARDFYAKRGAKYMLVVAPNKENVYPEYMPTTWQKVRKSDMSRADVALEFMSENSDVVVVNLKPILLKNKPLHETLLYFMRDTHWNAVGAYVGYGEMVKAMAKFGFRVPYPKLEQKMIVEKGMHAMDMDMSQQEMTYRVNYLDNVTTEEVLNEEHGKLVVFKAKNAPLQNKSLLMIRDSFSADLVPYFSKVFGTSIFLLRSDKAPERTDQLIKDYKVDLVIDEIVERRTDKFQKYKELYGGK